MKTVIAVVETGSFTAAGERLKISKALVSKYIGQVENQLEARLFNRSTRRLALTELGNNYYDNALPLIENFYEFSDKISRQSLPKGLLRISAPVTLGEMKLSPIIPEFLQKYPGIRIKLQLENRLINILKEGVDVAIRSGQINDSNLVARQISSLPLGLSAAPTYLKKWGIPKNANDLNKHICITSNTFLASQNWHLESANGKAYSIKTSARIQVNSPRAIKELAIAGEGIALLPKFITENAIKSGQLNSVLTRYSTTAFGLYAVYPHRKYLSNKVRCFVDFLLKKFSSEIAA